MPSTRRILTVLALTAAAVLAPVATAGAAPAADTVDDSAWGIPPIELPDLPELLPPLDSAWG